MAFSPFFSSARATVVPTSAFCRTLAQQNLGAFKTDADLAEATLFSFTLPGGTMGSNGTLRVLARYTHPASTTAKILRIRLGGAEMSSTTITSASVTGYMLLWHVTNRNGPSSQIGAALGTASGTGGVPGAYGTGSVNTAVDQPLTVTAQWGTAGSGANRITLETVLVELVPGV